MSVIIELNGRNKAIQFVREREINEYKNYVYRVLEYDEYNECWEDFFCLSEKYINKSLPDNVLYYDDRIDIVDPDDEIWFEERDMVIKWLKNNNYIKVTGTVDDGIKVLNQIKLSDAFINNIVVEPEERAAYIGNNIVMVSEDLYQKPEFRNYAVFTDRYYVIPNLKNNYESVDEAFEEAISNYKKTFPEFADEEPIEIDPYEVKRIASLSRKYRADIDAKYEQFANEEKKKIKTWTADQYKALAEKSDNRKNSLCR